MTATGTEALPAAKRATFVGIEGLRGIAAMSVVAHHAYKHTSDHAVGGIPEQLIGYMRHGLTLFFVLSGFLLFMPYVAAILGRRTWPSLKRYALGRFLRIYPGYLAVFVLVAFVFGAAYLDGAPATATGEPVGRMTDPVDIIANLFIAQTYVPGSLLTGIGPSWSLTTEVAFYVLLPALAWLGYRLGQRWSPLAGALAPGLLLIAVGFATKLFVISQTAGMTGAPRAEYSWGQGWSTVLDRSILSQADLFGFGMLTAVAVALLGSTLPAAARWAMLPAILVLCAVALKAPIHAFDDTATAIACGLLLVWVVTAPSGNPLVGALDGRVLTWLGLVSYSAYLWHVPVCWWLRERGLLFEATVVGYGLNLAVVVAVTLGLSTLTYYFVEKKGLDLKARLGAGAR